ncbi:uncharacterized protein LOC106645350 [Copidosoma floridanum]|uniref:uncharacterized protein LOC106645350 n=1 Tax=Copidosoma floridanum TaxID=29053 RepID=UPI0006C9DCA1|nr:uncharacterized protein LOC106645350 [Copidosoma floridanum]
MDVTRETKQALDNLHIAAERMGELWLTHHIGIAKSVSAGKSILLATASVALADAGKSILLATASVALADAHGNKVTVRALIDPGAERSFVAEHVLSQLSLKAQKISRLITGVGAEFSALVLDKLTNLLPKVEVDQNQWSHTKSLNLADPLFFKPSRIDCILGADVYSSIIIDGLVKGPAGTPIAQNSMFGWILTGAPTNSQSCHHSSVQVFHTYTEPSLDKFMEKFWEIEEVPQERHLTPEEQFCEDYFSLTYTRNPQGRFVVRLPFFKQVSFSGSRDIAVACLFRSEKRLNKNLLLADKYKAFMQEYLD